MRLDEGRKDTLDVQQRVKPQADMYFPDVFDCARGMLCSFLSSYEVAPRSDSEDSEEEEEEEVDCLNSCLGSL